MASKENDATIAVDNSDEDVFANPELLLKATKFDDANVSHDVELKIHPKVWKKPLKTSCSSCESGVSCTGSPKESMPALKTKRPKGVGGAPTGYVTGIGRGKRRFSTDENYNFYDDDSFPSSPTIETIIEDLNEMKIRIKSCPKGFISKDHLHPRNLYNRSSRTRTVVNTP